MTESSTLPSWAAAREARAELGHETRKQLIEAAALVFAQRGYARTTVADITQAAIVSRPAFYLYFASKDEVFAEVVAQVRNAFIGVHEIPGVDESDPVALGRSASAAVLAAYARYHELLTVIQHQAIADPEIARLWAEIEQRPIRRVARYIKRLRAQGQAHPAASADVVAEAIMGIFARFGRLAPADPHGFAELVEQLNSIYLRLLGVDSECVTSARVEPFHSRDQHRSSR